MYELLGVNDSDELRDYLHQATQSVGIGTDAFNASLITLPMYAASHYTETQLLTEGLYCHPYMGISNARYALAVGVLQWINSPQFVGTDGSPAITRMLACHSAGQTEITNALASLQYDLFNDYARIIEEKKVFIHQTLLKKWRTVFYYKSLTNT